MAKQLKGSMLKLAPNFNKRHRTYKIIHHVHSKTTMIIGKAKDLTPV